mmetsp:Transcript_9028/g.25016  ORF Transcript_9028/g.25016 Transcript_9028/m.25016 type:complete len:387 (+) Transcript_9028:97-1257(+)
MAANLDKAQQQTIVQVTLSLSAIVCGFVAYAQYVVLPRLALQKPPPAQDFNHNNNNNNDKPQTIMSEKGDSIIQGSFQTFLVMCLSTILLTGPLTYLHNDDFEAAQSNLTSSINFCESEFENLEAIAEPANTISSLTSYVPLAIMGIFQTGHSSSCYWKEGERDFVLCYATLFMIGIGSTLLHSFLTAATQGGDELPMLWFTAATSFCGLQVIFPSVVKGVKSLVVASVLACTAIYVQFRANFAYFYAMFSIYIGTLVFSIIYIALLMNWEARPNGARFKQRVLLPLARTCALTMLVAVWIWNSEMVGCAHAQGYEKGSVVAVIWDRVLHPLWHFTSGLAAFLLIQVFFAADGFAKGRGVPVIACSRWLGAPLVIFPNDRIHSKLV